MVEKYFGEIPAGEKIEKRNPMPATLKSTVKLYHEDNFAKSSSADNGISNSRTDSLKILMLWISLVNFLQGKKSPLYIYTCKR